MSTQSDRNLLFGMLALQMDFVDRDELLQAMRGWLLEKHRPLAELLVERGALSQTNAELLEDVLKAHVAAHDHNVRQSLSATFPVSQLTAALREIDDDDLQDSMAHCSEWIAPRIAAETDHAHRGEPPAAMGQPSSLDGRFRVLRRHAEGGLGEVLVARDRELSREVALKLIRPALADDREACARFRVEAEVTGGLEHPGIVPVYGFGTAADSRPFYAMQLIRGQTLAQSIREFHASGGHDGPRGRPAFRELVRRFTDVCNAVSYAHSRGVLHRDLKPGNVMLGRYGETLVVDWGLARLSGEPAADAPSTESGLLQPGENANPSVTQQGRVLGTLSYMSPEQAAGQTDALGPATDVYSLGAILYEILTGRPPVKPVRSADGSTDVAATLHEVCYGQISSPQDACPTEVRPLADVCLTALSRQPDDRYPSAESLRDDVDRWLDDETVTVGREPVLVRSRRWIRKHETVSATLATAVLISVIGLGSFSTVLSRKNANLVTLNATLDRANDELTAANDRARRASQVARDNEQTAREQSQLALATLTRIVTDLQQSLRHVPSAGNVRRRILLITLDQMDKVARGYVDDSAVSLSTAETLVSLGDVVLQFADDEPRIDNPDGNIVSADAGDESSTPAATPTALARTFFEAAHRQAIRLAEAAPGAESQLLLSATWTRRSDLAARTGDVGEASAALAQAMALSQSVAESGTGPSVDEAARMQCTQLQKRGDLELRSGNYDAALDSFTRAWEQTRALHDEQPGDRELERLLAVSCSRLGNACLRLNDPAAARKWYERDLDFSLRLAAAEPNSAQAKRDLLVSLTKLGEVQFVLEDLDAAVDSFRQALDLNAALTQDDPHDLRLQRDTVVLQNKVGDVELYRNRPDAAIAAYESALDRISALADADPADASLQRDVSISHEKLGSLRQQQGDLSEAERHFALCRSIRARLAEQEGANAQAQSDLLIALYNLGTLRQQQGQPARAVPLLSEAVDLLRALRDAGQLAPAQQQWLPVMEQTLEDCRQAAGDDAGSDDPRNPDSGEKQRDDAERSDSAEAGNTPPPRDADEPPDDD